MTALRAAFARRAVQTLSGTGGVGKTSLARAYAQRHQGDYDLIWWIAGEDPTTIDGQFRQLLGLLTQQQHDDAMLAVHGLLAARSGKWLLVIDNLPEQRDSWRLLPAAGNGHILITTRDSGHSTTSVGPLTRGAAVELLVTLSGDADQASASELADLMGRLPLALTQAGALCHATVMPMAVYLQEYRRRRAVLHRTGTVPDYNATVATTWTLAFERLSPGARALLTVLSFYAPDNIPFHILLADEESARSVHLLLADPLARHSCMGELLKYGLVTRSTIPGTINIHRLVQAVLHDQLAEPATWIERAKELLNSAWPPKEFTLTNTTRWRALSGHISALIDHLPPEDLDTMHMENRFAYWTGMIGDATTARDLNAALLVKHERLFGAENPDTLIVRHNAASWIADAGDPSTARDLYAVLIPTQLRVLGADHPVVLRSLHDMARCTGQAGEPAAARDMTASLIDRFERVFGVDDIATLVLRDNHASWTGVAGDVITARDLYRGVLEDFERVLTHQHPETLNVSHSHAYWTAMAGDVGSACALFADLMPDRKQLLGPEHAHTLLTQDQLAYWTEKAGDTLTAKEIYASLLLVQERVFGPGHPNTVITRDNLRRLS